MALLETSSSIESDRLRRQLVNLIHLRKPLAQLAQKVDRQACRGCFDTLLGSGIGGLGHPIGLMTGLQLMNLVCRANKSEKRH